MPERVTGVDVTMELFKSQYDSSNSCIRFGGAAPVLLNERSINVSAQVGALNFSEFMTDSFDSAENKKSLNL